MQVRKGDAVVVPRAPGEPAAAATGVVQGLRPDGLVVVMLPGGVRKAFRAEELEPLERP